MSVPAGFDTPSRKTDHGEDPSRASAHGGFGTAMLATVAVTTMVYAPMFLFAADIWDHVPRFVGPAWAALLLLAAPMTALLLNRRWPVATTSARAVLLGLPQLPLAVLLMWIDIWLDIRSGYLLAGSGEVEMAYGYGTAMAVAFGLLLVLLVAVAARVGATRQRP